MLKSFSKVSILLVTVAVLFEATPSNAAIQCLIATVDSSAVLPAEEGISETGPAYSLSFVVVENAQNQIVVMPIKSVQEMQSYISELTIASAQKKDILPQVVKSSMPRNLLDRYASRLLEVAQAEAYEGILIARARQRGDGDSLSFRVIDGYKKNGSSAREDAFVLKAETALSQGEKFRFKVPYFSQAQTWKKTAVEMSCVK